MGEKTGVNGLPEKEIAMILRMHNEGKSHKEISQKVDRAPNTVIRCLKRHRCFEDDRSKMSGKKSKLTKEDLDKILELYDSGAPIRKIMCTVHAGFAIIKEHILKNRNNYKRLVRKSDAFNLNDEEIKIIQTILDSSTNIYEASTDTGVSINTLYDWEKLGVISLNGVRKNRKSKKYNNAFRIRVGKRVVLLNGKSNGKFNIKTFPNNEIRLEMSVTIKDCTTTNNKDKTYTICDGIMLEDDKK